MIREIIRQVAKEQEGFKLKREPDLNLIVFYQQNKYCMIHQAGLVSALY